MDAKLGYKRALDGIRGVAIIAVVAYHALGWPPGGFLGVDLFFVLSGFLITTLLLEEHQKTGRVSLRRFYGRRTRRLLPALAALAAVSMTATVLANPEIGGDSLALLAGSFFYVGNFLQGFSNGIPAPFVHLWSLAAEEQFYLLWPVALLLLLRRGCVRNTARIVVLLIVALVVYRAGLAAAGASWRRLYYSPDTHATGLMIGCLFAMLRWNGWRPAAWVRLPSLGVVILSIVIAERTVMWSGYAIALVELSCALLIVSAAAHPGKLLALAPLVWFGQVSYSLYLWHLPILWLGGGHAPVLTAMVAVAAAAASYYLIEQPFRRRWQRAPQPVLAPAAAR